MDPLSICARPSGDIVESAAGRAARSVDHVLKSSGSAESFESLVVEVAGLHPELRVSLLLHPLNTIIADSPIRLYPTRW
jgi:hypothetical protein